MLQESQHLGRRCDEASPVIVLALPAGDESNASMPGESRLLDDLDDRVGAAVPLYDRIVILNAPSHGG